ncbi:MAG: DUF3303 family protein [Acidimicrobiales bacterium]
MIFVTTYKVKPYLTKEETAELMAVFAANGEGPGTIAHYVAADGSHGVVISDNEDLAASYRNILNYSPWVEYESRAMLAVQDAVPHIMDALG